MIEVEKKLSLSQPDIDRITQGAEFLGEKVITDTYFDKSDFKLTKADRWLRLRDGKFELKLPLNADKSTSQRELDQYQELITDEKIRESLGLPVQGTLAEALESSGYTAFSTIVTTRRKYKKQGFNIDLDVMDFGYSICEIEIMVDDQSETENALNKILAFALENQLKVTPVRGKVIEYIRRKAPHHYRVLQEANVA